MSLIHHLTPLEGTDRCATPETTTNNNNNNSSSINASTITSTSVPPTTTNLPFPFPPSSLPLYTHAPPSPKACNGSISAAYSPKLPPRNISPYPTVRSLRHVISYDAIPRPSAASQATHPTGGVAAYKVSTARRLAQILATTLACWLSSGIVFGFAALKPVLIEEGVYGEFCTEGEVAGFGVTGEVSGWGRGGAVCYEQELRLNFFFAIASTTCNVSALLVGTLLDRYGPRVATMIGCGFLAVGSLLMGAAFSRPEFDGYVAGNVFLALGGTFVFVPSFQIANAFPKYSGTIVALVTGAFDASAAVFLFYRIAYQASNRSFTPAKFFYGFLIVPALILLAQVTLMNSDGYKTVPQLEEKIEKHQDVARDVHDSDDDLSDSEVYRLRGQRRENRESVLAELDRLMGDADERQAQTEKREEAHATSGVWGVLHGKPAHEQMMSPWFILITLLTVLQMLRMNFFIASIRAQYENMLGSSSMAEQINSFFDVALPVGGVVATPFIGILLDRVSTASLLAVLVAMITGVGVLGSLPFVWTAYGNVVLFVLLRPLYYSAMSDYAAKVFGFATFGRVYGAIICLSGLVNLTQPLIDAVNHEAFHNNPIPINATLAALGLLIGVVLVYYVYTRGARAQQKFYPPHQMSERDRLIPATIQEE